MSSLDTFDDGRQAAEEGKSRTFHNPYLDGPDAEEWQSGWDSVDPEVHDAARLQRNGA